VVRCLLVLSSLILLTGLAAAATLPTTATVTIVSRAEADLDHWRADRDPVWSVAGEPGEQVQLHLEWRTPDGTRLHAGPARPAALDDHGDLATALPLPDADPHAPAAVITLVVCRE
jgi:hypothetical protein